MVGRVWLWEVVGGGLRERAEASEEAPLSNPLFSGTYITPPESIISYFLPWVVLKHHNRLASSKNSAIKAHIAEI